MCKKVAVLFSGGLDSTYLLWKNLNEGNEVYPIYIEIANNINKTILEKNRIELLCKEFNKEFKNGNLYNISYIMNINVSANESSLYFKQLPIWILGLMFLQSLNVDEIQIGYVSNDDAISYLDDIQNIYKSYQAVCEPMKPLVFPLTKMKKYIIASELPIQYRKFIISCENPKIIGSKDVEFIEYEPCCKCVPCKTIISNEYYDLFGFPNDKYARYLYWDGYNIIDKNGDNYFDRCNKVTFEPYQLEINFNQNDDKVEDEDFGIKIENKTEWKSTN